MTPAMAPAAGSTEELEKPHRTPQKEDKRAQSRFWCMEELQFVAPPLALAPPEDHLECQTCTNKELSCLLSSCFGLSTEF